MGRQVGGGLDLEFPLWGPASHSVSHHFAVSLSGGSSLLALTRIGS